MKYQFMPVFWGDFLANTLDLSAQEIGAYFLLIAHAWEHDGKIPHDRVRQIARVRGYHWPKVWERLEPFFEWEKDPTSGAPRWGTHVRVLTELHKAAEISNKRKDAALQKHSKSSANGYANDPHLHLQLPIEKLSNGKGSEAPQAKPAPTRQGPSPDPGLDYRSPPRTKSDNPLTPIPDQLLAKRP